MGGFEKHPDVAPASKVGDPTLEDKTPISASALVQQANRVALGKTGEKSVSVETTNTGEPKANEPAPRSDQPVPETPVVEGEAGSKTPDPSELKTDTPPADSAEPATAQAPDPNELKPNVAQDEKPAQAPAQVNDLAPGVSPAAAGAAEANGTGAAASGQDLADDNAVASSKHKKKKGLRKIIPLN
jgi:hypothetical protein